MNRRCRICGRFFTGHPEDSMCVDCANGAGPERPRHYKLDRGGARMRSLSLRLNEQEWGEARAIARRWGMLPSEAMRALIGNEYGRMTLEDI